MILQARERFALVALLSLTVAACNTRAGAPLSAAAVVGCSVTNLGNSFASQGCVRSARRSGGATIPTGAALAEPDETVVAPRPQGPVYIPRAAR